MIFLLLKPKSVIRTLECSFLLLFDDFCVFSASFVLLFVSIARYASRKEKRNLFVNPSKIITNPNDRIGLKSAKGGRESPSKCPEQLSRHWLNRNVRNGKQNIKYEYLKQKKCANLDWLAHFFSRESFSLYILNLHRAIVALTATSGFVCNEIINLNNPLSVLCTTPCISQLSLEALLIHQTWWHTTHFQDCRNRGW